MAKKTTKKEEVNPDVVVGIPAEEVKVEIGKYDVIPALKPTEVNNFMPAQVIDHPGLFISIPKGPFVVDDKLYFPQDHYLVMVENGRYYFAIRKNIINYFFKIFPK